MSFHVHLVLWSSIMGRMAGHQDSQGKEAMLSTCGRLMTM
jgi:hypothetical protein